MSGLIREGTLAGYHIGGQRRVTEESLRRYVAKLKGPLRLPGRSPFHQRPGAPAPPAYRAA